MKKILAASLSIVVSLCGPRFAIAEEPYSWHGGDSEVAYGVPETDDRMIRISCKKESLFSMSGPLRLGLKSGDKISFHIAGQNFIEKITVHEAGDGDNWHVTRVNFHIIKALMEGKKLEIHEKMISFPRSLSKDSEIIYSVSSIVPGLGSKKVLMELMASCPKNSKFKRS